ncbi:unnamed protein product [Taenia asiatica]|uniref:UBIQUITIN_CONJUGAT_2 domain-containing protein n=1 Tax=Taenia asiatica TaxID=60517 RepID=A0A0R3WF56_TAEAS|nr:unnamed protein product [Taenia asiatica]
MSGSALKRLMAEYKQLTDNPPEGIVAGPVDESNFFEWEAFIMGPDGTPFEGGVFASRLSFPPDYPLSPPKMRFTSNIFHPNSKLEPVKFDTAAQIESDDPSNRFCPLKIAFLVYPDGRVCISILHTPGNDPLGYESPAERWSPVQSVEKILLSVVSMLAEPNDESAANVDAAKTWRENRKLFNEMAMQSVRMSLGFPAEGDVN